MLFLLSLMIMIYNFLLYEGGDDFDDQVGCTLVALFVQFSGVVDYDKVKLYYIVIIKFQKIKERKRYVIL